MLLDENHEQTSRGNLRVAEAYFAAKEDVVVNLSESCRVSELLQFMLNQTRS